MSARRPDRGYIFVAVVLAVILASRLIPLFLGYVWGPSATRDLDRFMGYRRPFVHLVV